MILKHDGYIAEIVYEEGDETMHGATSTRAPSCISPAATSPN
jgi:hypothetical protein